MNLCLKQYNLYDNKKYTEEANIIFIIIFKKWEARSFQSKYILFLYRGIFQNEEIPLSCVKTKVSQLRKYKNTGDTFNISANYIKLFNAVRNIDSNKLQRYLEQALLGECVNFYKLDSDKDSLLE